MVQYRIVQKFQYQYSKKLDGIVFGTELIPVIYRSGNSETVVYRTRQLLYRSRLYRIRTPRGVLVYRNGLVPNRLTLRD